jgi:ribonuclease BN (tRNA processing enzyme)
LADRLILLRSNAEERRIELTFLGTRGEIKIRSRRHFRHSALLVRQGRARVMIDCGADWLSRLKRIDPTAIVLTHAHGDHASGLAHGAPCPVFATAETLTLIARFSFAEARVIEPRRPFSIGMIGFEAFPVDHSLRAPAVGYRVSAGRAAFFYVPDLAALRDPAAALQGVDLYIGDGATVTRSMVRRRGRDVIGHATVGAQLAWCREQGVGRAIFTHCGSEIVRSDAPAIAADIAGLGQEQGVEASLAYDGQRLVLS